MCRAPKAALSSSGDLRAQGTHSALPMQDEEVLMAVVEVSSSSQTHGEKVLFVAALQVCSLGQPLYTSCTIPVLLGSAQDWALSEKRSKLSSCGAGAARRRSPASCNAHTQTPRDYCRSF